MRQLWQPAGQTRARGGAKLGGGSLINNAGVLASFDLLDSSDDALATDFNTNAFGVVAAIKAFLPALTRGAARRATRHAQAWSTCCRW